MNGLDNPAHKQTYPIYQYFKYDHLPPHLQAMSKPFHNMATNMLNTVGGSVKDDEIVIGLRKLLEAKDCFVRAAIDKGKGVNNSNDEAITQTQVGTPRFVDPVANAVMNEGRN